MSKLPDSVIDSARADIVSVVEGYGVQLEKRGKDFFALCPFHNEKSASFTVTPSKGRYHCFGCGADGDAIQFVQDYEDVGFRDAVQKINGSLPADLKAHTKRDIERDEPEEWVPMPVVPDGAPVPMDILNRKIDGKWIKLVGAGRWEYRNADGALIGYVYRFNKPGGGKEVMPQVYCTNQQTGELAWRWLSFPKPRPIYGLDKLAANPKAQVIGVEGEKACDAAQSLFVAAGVPLAKLVIISWPGGGKAVKHVDWSPLFGRSVGLWPDADLKTYVDKHPRAGQVMPFLEQPGTIAMLDIFDAIAEHCTKVKFFVPPAGVPDGWDLADELPAGFDLIAHAKAARLAENIRDEFAPVVEPDPAPPQATDLLPWEGPDEFAPVVEPDPAPPQATDLLPWEGPDEIDRTSAQKPVEPEPAAAKAPPPDDGNEEPGPAGNGYFTILGYDHDRYYIFAHGKGQIAVLQKGDLSETGLIELAPLNWWEENFPGGKSAAIDKKAAANFIIRTAEKRGIYDISRIRGRGAWVDNGRFVYHHGAHLSVDGIETDITKIKSHYVYELSQSLPAPADTALTSDEGAAVLKLVKQFRWAKPGSAVLFVGWVALAPVCGAIPWRPHLWMTGGAGSGKSTIAKIAHSLLRGTDVFAQGSSSEAGIRQRLKADARPVLMDESESNEEGDARRIQSILSLIRQASTESDAETLKGTADGSGMAFHIRSMFCLASIQVALKNKADIDRLSVLSLRGVRESGATDNNWKHIRDDIYRLIDRDQSIAQRLLRRSIDLLPVTLKNIEVFSEVAAARFGSQRDGDQYGTLMAGAWSLTSEKQATLSEAEAMIDQYDWSEHLEHNEIDDAQRALSVLLESHIRFVGQEYTVYELVHAAAGEPDGIKLGMAESDAVLQRYGMRVKDDRLLLSNQSQELPRLMEGTPFASGLRGMLLRVKGADRYDNRSLKFNGSNSKCISLPLKLLFSDDTPALPGDMEEF